MPDPLAKVLVVLLVVLVGIPEAGLAALSRGTRKAGTLSLAVLCVPTLPLNASTRV